MRERFPCGLRVLAGPSDCGVDGPYDRIDFRLDSGQTGSEDSAHGSHPAFPGYPNFRTGTKKNPQNRPLQSEAVRLPAGLANRYFSRAKKQYRATVLSLFISIVLFVSASAYSTYLKKSLFDAKAVPEYDVSVYGVHDPKLRQEIASVDGVEQALYVQECYPDILLKPEQMDESARKELWEMEKDENGYLHLDGELLVLSDEDYEKWLLSAGLAVPEEKDGQIPLIIGNEVRAYHSATGRYQTVKTLKSAGEPVTGCFYRLYRMAGGPGRSGRRSGGSGALSDFCHRLCGKTGRKRPHEPLCR